nr:hypothetical protein Itr_chr12CG13070 [Ipomoea trifida]
MEKIIAICRGKSEVSMDMQMPTTYIHNQDYIFIRKVASLFQTGFYAAVDMVWIQFHYHQCVLHKTKQKQGAAISSEFDVRQVKTI